MMANYLPLIVLFSIHLSQLLIQKPHPCTVLESNFQNNSSACSVPYNAFLSCIYSIAFTFWLYHTNLFYVFGSSLMTNSVISPSSTMCHPLMFACRNAPGISITTTYWLSFVSIAHNIIASSDTVGELDSQFVVYSFCGQPYLQPHAFIVPSCFSYNDIRHLVLSFFRHMSFILFNRKYRLCIMQLSQFFQYCLDSLIPILDLPLSNIHF